MLCFYCFVQGQFSVCGTERCLIAVIIELSDRSVLYRVINMNKGAAYIDGSEAAYTELNKRETKKTEKGCLLNLKLTTDR